MRAQNGGTHLRVPRAKGTWGEGGHGPEGTGQEVGGKEGEREREMLAR